MGEHRKVVPTRLNEVERAIVARVTEMLGSESAAIRFMVVCFANIAEHLAWDWNAIQRIRCSTPATYTQDVLPDGGLPNGLVLGVRDPGKRPPHRITEPKVNRRRMARMSLLDSADHAGMGLLGKVSVPFGITPFGQSFASPVYQWRQA